MGASDISKRGTYVDFGMGKNEGVFNAARTLLAIFFQMHHYVSLQLKI